MSELYKGFAVLEKTANDVCERVEVANTEDLTTFAAWLVDTSRTSEVLTTKPDSSVFEEFLEFGWYQSRRFRFLDKTERRELKKLIKQEQKKGIKK